MCAYTMMDTASTDDFLIRGGVQKIEQSVLEAGRSPSAKRQLRLRHSGEPSCLSLRKRWIFRLTFPYASETDGVNLHTPLNLYKINFLENIKKFFWLFNGIIRCSNSPKTVCSVHEWYSGCFGGFVITVGIAHVYRRV